MTNPQEQYFETLRNGQEAAAAAFDSWNKAAQQAFGGVPTTPFPMADPGLVIDQVFDFAEKLLESQRSFAKNLVQASASVTDTLREQAEATAENAAQSANKAATLASKAAKSASAPR